MSYISQTDYKKLMGRFQKQTPKKLLKEYQLDGPKPFESMKKTLVGKGKNESFNRDSGVTILDIKPGKDSGYSRGAIGSYYDVKLSNGKNIEASDEDFLERFKELRTDGKLPFEQLKQVLVGKEWNELDESLNEGYARFTNEEQAPFGFSVLSPDERKQLKEYIQSLKTIKKEVAKLLEKAGKTEKVTEKETDEFVKEVMNDGTAAQDEKIPAARKPVYNVPTKKAKPGGDRTGLVMTKAEMWEEGGTEERVHPKIHVAFQKLIKALKDEGLNEPDIKMFIKHEIEKAATETVTSQYDPS